MKQKNKKLTCLSELARELNINKSCLSYWQKKKIIEPEYYLGRMAIFNYKKTMKIIKDKIT